MGVPVITLAGTTFVSRAGVTLLTNIGLKELIAETPEDYIKTVSRLASNIPYLQQLRRELRQKMLSSPLMDAKRFTQNLETAFRHICRKWCENHKQ